MKRVNTPLSRSKSAILFVLVASGISLAIPACKKDDAAAPAVSQEEVKEVVTNALSANGGLMFQTNTAVQVAQGYDAGRQAGRTISEECGVAHDNNISIATTAFTYSMKWNWLLSCTTEKEPQSVAFSFAGKVVIETAKLKMRDTTESTFKIEGLESDSSLLVFNQSVHREGILELVTDNATRSFASVLTYNATNVKVNKATGKIVSGTAAVTISGVSTKGKFLYAGTITYKGDNKCTFNIVGGQSFELILQ